MKEKEAAKAGFDILRGRKLLDDFTNPELIQIDNTFTKGIAQGVAMPDGCRGMLSNIEKKLRKRNNFFARIIQVLEGR